MSKIVCVHGIGQQFEGEDSLLREWTPALRDGVRRAGSEPPEPEQLKMAFYGNLFRKSGTKAVSVPAYDETDIADEWEKALLEEWWREASRVGTVVSAPDDVTKLRTPRVVQRALNALSQSRFFVGVATNLFIADLKQVYAYLHDDDVREGVQQVVDRAVAEDTRVIVAHSLGTVVAYEALAAHPKWPVQTLITLGSPLGIRNLVFDLLRPAPVGSVGIWPNGLSIWVNVADDGDIVALEKKVGTRFGDRVEDRLVYNGAKAHDARPYLTTAETGDAVARGLRV